MSTGPSNAMYRNPLSIGLILLVVVSLAVYWPGLYGPFLFDDFANLDALGRYGGIRDWESFKLFVFGNHSGPTGRPVAMLSFLLNASDWPADPWPFKFTNLILHIACGLLLFVIVRRLLNATGGHEPGVATIAAFLTAGFWLLHPLNVSTVLYPVQRMAILATLFVLCGILGYIHGRKLLQYTPVKGHLWMAVSIGLFTVLATYSKENGALLPLLVLSIEITVFARPPDIHPNRYWKVIFLWGPAVLLAGYFIHGLTSGSIPHGYIRRPFSLDERLLTQPRILFDYLYYWFVPLAPSPGLFTQDFPLSRSLANPPTTIAAILCLTSMLVLAVHQRKKYPIISLAVLFYFTGHLIESSLIALELYFEHRNYLPAVFLVLPVSLWIAENSRDKRIWLLPAAAMIIAAAYMAHKRALIWSTQESMAYHWAGNRPFSQRAQRYAAMVADKHGKYQLAYNIMSQAKNNLPDRIAIQFHWLVASCKVRTISAREQHDVLRVLKSGFYSFGSVEQLTATMELIHHGNCQGIRKNLAFDMLNALQNNGNTKTKRGAMHQIHHVRGILYLHDGKVERAGKEFHNSQKILPTLESGLVQVAILATHKQYALALSHLEYIQKIVDIEKAAKLGKLDYQSEIAYLKNNILQDLLKHRENTPDPQ